MDSLKEIVESILFVSGDPVEFVDIAEKLNIEINEVKKAIKELKASKEESFSGIQVQMFNNKAQLCSNPAYAEKVAEVLNPIKEKALTKAVLEVAAIVAYKQPITRLEIEQVRGVNSDYAVNMLIENNFIEIVGRKDALGKPLLFGTTDTFLKRFNLESIDSLPDYEELLDRIKVIKNPDNSLFDFSNIPDSKKDIHESDVNEVDGVDDNDLDEEVESGNISIEDDKELNEDDISDTDSLQNLEEDVKDEDVENIVNEKNQEIISIDEVESEKNNAVVENEVVTENEGDTELNLNITEKIEVDTNDNLDIDNMEDIAKEIETLSNEINKIEADMDNELFVEKNEGDLFDLV